MLGRYEPGALTERGADDANGRSGVRQHRRQLPGLWPGLALPFQGLWIQWRRIPRVTLAASTG